MLSLFQFSIRGLLSGMALVSLGIAALVNAGPLWQGIMWGVALYALTAAILLVVYRRSETRAFWLGFTIFGWLYLLLFLTSQAPAQFQFWSRSDPLKYSDLLATRLAETVHAYLPESRRLMQVAVTPPTAPSAGGSTTGSMPMAGGYEGGMSPMSSGMAAPGDMDMMVGMDGSMNGMMSRSSGSMMPGGMMMSGMTGPTMVANVNYVPLENFQHVFHALALLLVAAVGGKTCQIIHRTKPAAP